MKKFLALAVVMLIGLTTYAILPSSAGHISEVLPLTDASFGQNMVYFAFTFVLSFIGSYIIYGILVGPASLLGVYILTKDKIKRIYAWIGFILGTMLGIYLKILVLS